MKKSDPSAHRALRVLRGEKLLSCLLLTCAAVVLISAHAPQAPAPPPATLVGWATLPVDTFAPGPTTGQFAGAGQFGHALPVVDKQVVQGFSAVINGPAPGTFYVLMDNGFGTKANSADSLLRVYAIRPSFRTASGGDASVSAANFQTGAALPSFTADSFITLSDPERKLGFGITADQATYYGRPDAPAVAPVIKQGRLLTGADLDPESFRKTPDGHFWFGDEFGPFLFETDASGRVLRRGVSLPGVFAAENPLRGDRTANLGASRGFEGLAMSPTGDRLFALLEGVVTGERAGMLRINEFSLSSAQYTGRTFLYRLDPNGTNIGDMTAVNDHEFLVVERNGSVGDAATPLAFKKIFSIDSARLDADGAAVKTEIVDLMNLPDPNDLNRDGKTTFTFPFVTIEDVLMIDANTILVINDNNYPGGGGRGQTSDATEVLLIRVGTGGTGGTEGTGGTAGTVRGRVTDARGAPLPGVTVTAMPQLGGVIAKATTRVDGSYEIGRLLGGAFRVDFDLRGFDLARQNLVRIRDGASVDLDVSLRISTTCECIVGWPNEHPRSSPRLRLRTGQVLNAVGQPLPHAQLAVRIPAVEDGGSEGANADEGGYFTVRAPLDQPWQLTAVDTGFGPETLSLSASPSIPLVFHLAPLAAADIRPSERLGRACRCGSDLFTHPGR